MLIEVQALCHTYAIGTPLAHRALNNVTLQIAPGEKLGIVGHTGSGKSTLVQHIAGLLTPTSGHVLLDGVPAHKRSSAARAQRRHIGVAFQSPEEQIFERTVFREIAFGPRNLGLKQEELTARVHWALGLVGLDPLYLLDRSPFALSGGERRRVALASVLASRPNVLILDEPTAGLDPRGRAELLDRVAAWPAEHELTLLFVSHDLSALATVADRVIVLHEGGIQADGRTKAVLSDAESLSAAGLRPPSPAELLRRLRRTGWPVRTDELTVPGAAAEILRAWSRSRTSAPLSRRES